MRSSAPSYGRVQRFVAWEAREGHAEVLSVFEEREGSRASIEQHPYQIAPHKVFPVLAAASVGVLVVASERP